MLHIQKPFCTFAWDPTSSNAPVPSFDSFLLDTYEANRNTFINTSYVTPRHSAGVCILTPICHILGHFCKLFLSLSLSQSNNFIFWYIPFFPLRGQFTQYVCIRLIFCPCFLMCAGLLLCGRWSRRGFLCCLWAAQLIWGRGSLWLPSAAPSLCRTPSPPASSAQHSGTARSWASKTQTWATSRLMLLSMWAPTYTVLELIMTQLFIFVHDSCTCRFFHTLFDVFVFFAVCVQKPGCDWSVSVSHSSNWCEVRQFWRTSSQPGE